MKARAAHESTTKKYQFNRSLRHSLETGCFHADPDLCMTQHCVPSVDCHPHGVGTYANELLAPGCHVLRTLY